MTKLEKLVSDYNKTGRLAHIRCNRQRKIIGVSINGVMHYPDKAEAKLADFFKSGKA